PRVPRRAPAGIEWMVDFRANVPPDQGVQRAYAAPGFAHRTEHAEPVERAEDRRLVLQVPPNGFDVRGVSLQDAAARCNADLGGRVVDPGDAVAIAARHRV